jgi:hypothetical protein
LDSVNTQGKVLLGEQRVLPERYGFGTVQTLERKGDDWS